MIMSGRCHGPRCQQAAVVEFWCSEACKIAWDRQAAGLAASQPQGFRPASDGERALAAALQAAQPEVDRYLREAIDAQVARIETVQPQPSFSGSSIIEDILRASEALADLPHWDPVKLTSEQLAAVREACPPPQYARPWPSVELLAGRPIELVGSVEESTPYLTELARYAHAVEANAAIARGASYPLVASESPQVAQSSQSGWLVRWLHRMRRGS